MRWRTQWRIPRAARVAKAVLLGASVLASSAGMAACGNAGGAPVRLGGSVAKDPRSAAIIAAWRAAQVAFGKAARTSNAESTELFETMTSPQLDRVRANLSNLRSLGFVSRGSAGLGQPRLIDIGDNRATVVSCIHDAEVEVSTATGQPAPGDLGTVAFERLTSIMKLVLGVWRLADQQVVVNGCRSL